MKIPLPIIRLLNSPVSAILRSPLHSLLSKDMMLLTFTGRRTGQAYTTPVSYIRDGSLVRCFTHSPWAQNLRGGKEVTVRIQGKELTGRSEVISGDVARVSEALGTFLTRIPRDVPYYDVALDAEKRPIASDVRRAAESIFLIEIQL